MSFNHPIVRQGTVGKKIHRGLKVSDEREALRLRGQINELLALAEKGPSAIPPRHLADKQYHDVVVSAFYDCMNPEPTDYMAIREKALPLPKGFPEVQIVGATGVGKTRVAQHLSGTTRENFPMKGAGRTTIADTEIIADDADYEAVVTFYSENEIREVIKGNIMEACEFAYANPEDTARIAAKLLVDPDKRFRLNFVLGNVRPAADVTEIDEEDVESEEVRSNSVASTMITSDDKEAHAERVESYVARIVEIARQGNQRAREDLSPKTSEDDAVVEEYWLNYIDEGETDSLVDEILEVLTERLRRATGSARWPGSYRVLKTSDRDPFFTALLPFYDNHRKFFGSLVTPLVQGIRVRGRFYPTGLVTDPAVSWVLQDGQGLGHDQEHATQTGTVPPEISSKFETADVICLVERAVPPMISGAPAPLLVSELVSRGQIDKLVMVFTHFEAVNAPDLDQPGRKAKVLESVAGVVQSLESLPKTQRVKLETDLESKAYFLAHLDRDCVGEGSKRTRSEFQRLCERFKSCAKISYTRRKPQYNEYRIAEAVSREISTFREDWGAEALSAYHWKIMQALTNWIGNAYGNGYPGRNLYPGQDLARRLIAAISVELEDPKGWVPAEPKNADEKSAILNAIRIQVSRRIDDLCRLHVIQDARTPDWLPAYRDIFGPGTKRRRATRVARILADRASLPEEGLGEFVKEIWKLVSEGIDAALDQHEAQTASPAGRTPALAGKQ